MELLIKKGNQVKLLLSENIYAKIGSNTVGLPENQNEFTDYSSETPQPINPDAVVFFIAEHDIVNKLDTQSSGIIVSNTGELFAKLV